MQTWYCSVSLRWKRRLGAGAFTSSGRTWGPLRTGSTAFLCAFSSRRCRSSCLRFPAADTTTLPGTYIERWKAPIVRRVTDEITSARPITGRPSGCVPKVASEIRSCTSSCGWSSYIAISSSTTSRSASSSAKVGAKTISPMTSSAVSSRASGTRAYTTVCSREVAAFSSPPRVSNVSAISCAL